MAENLQIIQGATREELFKSLLPQLHSLVVGEPDFIANTANIMAGIMETFRFHWVGCYFVQGSELILGPFQGPVACTRIAKGKGVCGAAWANAQSVVVADVDQFSGHIACSSLSRSEVVVPIFHKLNHQVIGVLDIDSALLNDFSKTDQQYFEEIAVLIGQIFPG